MENSEHPSKPANGSWLMATLRAMLKWALQQIVAVCIAFLLGTVIAAGLLWYRDLPLVLAPIGGFLAIGVWLIYVYER